MKLTQIFTLILVLAASIFAGDFAKLEVIGFSADGRYLAFEEYGTLDGSGFPYSNVYFVDTAKNAFAAAPARVRLERETATEAQARRQAATLAAKSLAAYRIRRGQAGTLVVSHLLTDKSFGDKDPVVRFNEEVGSMYHKGDYELELKKVEVKVKPCDEYGDDTFMIDLRLKDRENNTTKILQKDTTLPQGRGCVIDYRIGLVYVYNGTVAVFLNTYTRGFEGPDVRHLVVTGRLK
jgi:predicted secreted protein